MAISADGILQATFDPQWATVGLIVDGGMWPGAVALITISRNVAGEPAVVVRGVDRREVVSGYFTGSDPEAPLNSSVTYIVDGFSATGARVKTASVTVSTAGAAHGAWLKVAGQPNATSHAVIRSTGEVQSVTQGGVYNIIGGRGVAVGAAAGIDADTFSLTIGSLSREQDGAIRRTLAASRVLLVQGCEHGVFDDGWYFIQSVSRALRDDAALLPGRNYTLDLVRTGVPSGAGQGVAGWSWAAVTDTYATWQDLMGAQPTWFSTMQGV